MPPTIKQVQFTGGVNLFEDPRLIGDNELQYAKNLFPYTPGILSKRLAMRPAQTDYSYGYAVDIGGPTIPWWPNIFIPPFSGIYAVVAGSYPGINRTLVYVIGENGTSYADWGESAGGSQTPALNRRLSMFAFQNRIYILGGSPWTIPALAVYQDPAASSGVTVAPFAFAGTGNGNLTPRVAGVYKERVVWADLGPGYEDYLVFSDPYEPDVIGNDATLANGRAFTIGGRAGDRIVALVEVAQGGIDSPTQSALLILRQFSAYLITGEPNLTTDPATEDMFGSMAVNRINMDLGCASAETVVRTEHGVLWASNTDVWLMPPAGMPIAVGTKLRPALQRAPAQDVVNWHASFFNGTYRLSIHGEGQGPLYGSTTEAEDMMLRDQWWLDLRQGTPRHWKEAMWWGPQQYAPYVQAGATAGGMPPAAPDLRPNHVPDLISIYRRYANIYSPDFIFVSLNGKSPQDYVSTYDIQTGLVNAGFVAGQLVPKKYVADGMVNLRLMSSEIRIRLTKNASLQLDVSMDDGRRVDTVYKSVFPGGFMLPAGYTYGWVEPAPSDEPILSNAFQALSIYPSQTMVGADGEIILVDRPGIVVPPGGYQFYISHPLGDHWFTLPGDYYQGLDDVMSKLIEVLQALPIDQAWGWVYDINHKFILTNNTYSFTFWPSMEPGEAMGAVGTDAQRAQNATVWAMLGFTTSPQPISATHTADLVAPNKEVAAIEIAGLTVKLDTFGKRP